MKNKMKYKLFGKTIKKYNYWDIRIELPEGRTGKDLILSKETHYWDSSKDTQRVCAINLEDDSFDNLQILLTYIKKMLNTIERENIKYGKKD